MENLLPRVSVCMLAYNVEPYLEAAIGGVLGQQTDFPVELVIGEDCSRDGTRRISDAYAARYPGRIVVPPARENLGIAGNAARTLAHCRGEYIAICDGDDVWIDPHKLQKQVDFLDAHPDYGAVYTDVQTVDERGAPFDDPEHAELRGAYGSGDVFFKLLGGNFINNSTAVFRRALLADHVIDTDRHYFTHDHLVWLHIAAAAKIHFFPEKTTAYRKHLGGVTNSAAKLQNNRDKFIQHLPGILKRFDGLRSGQKLEPADKVLLFRKILSLLYRGGDKPAMLRLALRYFPGVAVLGHLIFNKIAKRSSADTKLQPSHL